MSLQPQLQYLYCIMQVHWSHETMCVSCDSNTNALLHHRMPTCSSSKQQAMCVRKWASLQRPMSMGCMLVLWMKTKTTRASQRCLLSIYSCRTGHSVHCRFVLLVYVSMCIDMDRYICNTVQSNSIGKSDQWWYVLLFNPNSPNTSESL
jgi:hypothetical protein